MAIVDVVLRWHDTVDARVHYIMPNLKYYKLEV